MEERELAAPAYVYMVRCGGGRLYTGWTNDPAARLHAHRTGRGAKATRAFGALTLAYLEPCADKSAALRREAALKKLTKAEKEALCAGWAEASRPRLAMASRADAADILALYNWYVRNRTATYQITPSALPEYERWVEDTLARAPLLTARDAAGRLMGYACAHPYHPREAFAWDVESTIYCAPDACGTGAAHALYAALLELLERQGYWNVYALVADPNPASERFHEKFGFACVGRQPHCAYKLGRWAGCPPGGCRCAKAPARRRPSACSSSRKKSPPSWQSTAGEPEALPAAPCRAAFLRPGAGMRMHTV